MTVPHYDDGAPHRSPSSEGQSPPTASIWQRAMLQLQKGKLLRVTPARVLFLSVCSASVVAAQIDTKPASVDPTEMKETDAGIPVTDKLTIEKCGTCHAPDEKGNLSRISWIRAAPEGWAQAIKRMVELNGAPVSPADARKIVSYLGTYHGLAPEEAKPVMYLAEKRIQDETIIPNGIVQQACAACHALAQPMSSRRSKREWALLQNMHVALYSQAEAQYNRPVQGETPPNGPDGKPLLPGQVALDWLSTNAMLHTPEWAAWSPRIRTPQLAGKWVVSAFLPGKGRYVGEMIVGAGSAPDSFTTTTTLRSLSGQPSLSNKGSGLIYAGYSWRGSSTGAKASSPGDPSNAGREVMWFSPDGKTAQGRWFWGAYQEFGFDVSLSRASAAPTISAVVPSSLKTGTKGASVHIYGDSLPAQLTPADVDFGAGVAVTKIVSAKPGELVVSVDVADKTVPGIRDVAVSGAVLQKALPIYEKVDYLKVTPETSLAHLGGIKYDKGYQQFDVVGYANGPDGKPNTADDIAIGPVPVTWSMQEFPTVTYDDDKSFIGTLGPDGLFTPSFEGPNPKRRFSRNNYGEVWVVATAKTEKDKYGKPLIGKSYLVVTVPTYKRIDQPEVAQ